MNFSDFTTPSTPLFFKCNTLKIPDIYTLEVAKLIHNFLSKKNPDSFRNFFYCKMKFTTILQDHLHQKYIFTSVKYNLRKTLFKIPRSTDMVKSTCFNKDIRV